ncbi:DUF1330 domain-containing protein [Sphingomonas sp. CLY1604]|uniref:DUF1330 domain-containing protein n=1 Tax=Sphingomonas sp. CLY1604 TaxID=3457786 RepID=UPI003FD894B1
MSAVSLWVHDLIDNYDVRDEAPLARYAENAGPLVARHGGSMIAFDAALTPVEGAASSTLAVIRFPSTADAKAFFESAEYRKVRDTRIDATAGGFLALVAGVG